MLTETEALQCPLWLLELIQMNVVLVVTIESEQRERETILSSQTATSTLLSSNSITSNRLTRCLRLQSLWWPLWPLWIKSLTPSGLHSIRYLNLWTHLSNWWVSKRDEVIVKWVIRGIMLHTQCIQTHLTLILAISEKSLLISSTEGRTLATCLCKWMDP